MSNLFKDPEINQVDSKLDRNKSRFQSKKEVKQNFVQATKEHAMSTINNNNHMYQLGLKFLNLMKKSTLEDNLGPLDKSLEQEILTDLVKFSEELNYESSCSGSNALIVLLLKTSLINRNNYNKALYKIEKLEEEIQKLKNGN